MRTRWAAAGWLNVSAGFLILTFYSVIAGWGLAYILKVAGGTFTNAGTDAVSKEFGDLLASPWTLTGWHAAFMALTIFIVGRGVQKGIETAVKVLMPSLFVMRPMATLTEKKACPAASRITLGVILEKSASNRKVTALGKSPSTPA